MQTVCPCLGVALERPWLAVGGPFLYPHAQMFLENSPHLVGPPFSSIKKIPQSGQAIVG